MDKTMAVAKIETRKKTSDELKARVKAIVPQLPTNYRAIILLHYREYNSVAGGQRIDNVKRQKSSDKELTEILEAIAAGELTLSTKRTEFLQVDA